MNSAYGGIVVALACTGCASFVNEATHPIKVDTRTEAGEALVGADCRLTNDQGEVTMKSGDTAQVRRSNHDLSIVCSHPAQPDAVARAISRANAGMFGNILIGGGVGAVIDHSKNTAYTYPTWVQLVFGKTLLFDRNTEKDGQPMVGSAPVAAP